MNDDLVLLLESMGLEKSRDGAWVGEDEYIEEADIDANFIVGTVIPWAAEKGWHLTISGPDMTSDAYLVTVIPRPVASQTWQGSGTFVGAFVAACAAALRGNG
jgi:hypothetical protein